MNKRIFILVLGVVLIFSFVSFGCGGNSDDTNCAKICCIGCCCGTFNIIGRCFESLFGRCCNKDYHDIDTTPQVEHFKGTTPSPAQMTDSSLALSF